MNPVSVFVPLGVVFPDTPDDFGAFKSLLQQLSRTDTLFWCARLNAVVTNPANPDHRAKQEYGLHMFFTVEEIERINSFAQSHGGIGKVTVFFRGQLLELMRWVSLFCQDDPEDGITYEMPEVRHAFAQAAMMASDLWARRIYRDKISLESGREEARNRALGAIRQSISETSAGMNPLEALGRGKALFSDYLTQFYPNLEENFFSRTSLTLEQYYICLSALMTHYLNRTPSIVAQGTKHSGLFNVNTVCGQAPHMLDVFTRYFALESQTAEELCNGIWVHRDVSHPDDAGQYNMNILRRRPIFCAPDGRAIILDPVFYAERAAIGPLFLLSESMSGSEANQFFSAFGYAFESYASDILRRMYPEPVSGLINRFVCNVKGRDQSGQTVQIADACLNDVADVVLFEMKAVWLRDDVVIAENHERYLLYFPVKRAAFTPLRACHSIRQQPSAVCGGRTLLLANGR